MNRFWNFSEGEDGVRVLRFDGIIAEESWWDDDITPDIFRKELFAGEGDVIVWINSPGGDCIAASQIYAMLLDYKGKVTVKIDGLAASAASVIAMAGNEILMSPTALLMVHNPMTHAIGDCEEMQKAIELLSAVKESIINAYQRKSNLGRVRLSNLMDAETWIPANTAIDMGFADGFIEDNSAARNSVTNGYTFSRKAVTNSLLDKMNLKPKAREEPTPTEPQGITAESLEKRLSLISH